MVDAIMEADAGIRREIDCMGYRCSVEQWHSSCIHSQGVHFNFDLIIRF